MGEEVSGPSNETEVESLLRRLVEAVEGLHALMEQVVNTRTGSIEVTTSIENGTDEV